MSDDRGAQIARTERVISVLAWVPAAAVALACVVFNLRLRSAADILTGASIMTGFLFGFVLFAFQLRLRITDDSHVPTFGSTRSLINRAFGRGIQAVIVSLGATLLAVLADNFVTIGAGTHPTHLNRYWTAIIALLGLRLVALVVMAVYDLFRAYRQIPG